MHIKGKGIEYGHQNLGYGLNGPQPRHWRPGHGYLCPEHKYGYDPKSDHVPGHILQGNEPTLMDPFAGDQGRGSEVTGISVKTWD